VSLYEAKRDLLVTLTLIVREVRLGADWFDVWGRFVVSKMENEDFKKKDRDAGLNLREFCHRLFLSCQQPASGPVVYRANRYEFQKHS
jgi:hypothetical protein